MAKIGFIGMGNMGYAMLKGVLNVFEPSDIIFTCPDLDKCKRISDETGVKYAESNAECANNAQYIVLAVKPQVYSAVMKNIVNVIREDSVVISIVYYTIKLIYDPEFSKRSRYFCRALTKFFNSFGKVVYVDEKLMDVIVCASGSSPAYVYMFIEALADSAVKYGIKRDDAYKLVAQTVLGSAKMVLETNEHPGVLKDKVCSPGGTTIAGVAALEEHNFRNAVIKATDACYDKCHNIK